MKARKKHMSRQVGHAVATDTAAELIMDQRGHLNQKVRFEKIGKLNR